MAVKHYMSIFLDDRLHQAVHEAASTGELTKSKIGRRALELYLGLSHANRSWLEKLADGRGTSISTALNDALEDALGTTYNGGAAMEQ